MRTSMEWDFDNIGCYFASLNFKKGFKTQLSAVGKMYNVCVSLINDHACLYLPMITSYFDVELPHFNEYFKRA